MEALSVGYSLVWFCMGKSLQSVVHYSHFTNSLRCITALALTLTKDNIKPYMYGDYRFDPCSVITTHTGVSTAYTWVMDKELPKVEYELPLHACAVHHFY